MDIIKLRSDANGINGDISKDEIVRIWKAVGMAKQLLKEVETTMKENAITYMRDKGMDIIELSPTEWLQLQNKYYDRQAKPDIILSKLIDVTHGNAQQIGACLSSGAFKPATTKKVLEESKIDSECIRGLFWKQNMDDIVLVEHNEDETKFIKH